MSFPGDRKSFAGSSSTSAGEAAQCSQIRSAKFGHCWVDRTKTYSQIVRWLRVICDEDGPLVSIIDALNMDKCSLRISKITLGCVYYGKLLQVGRIVFESIQCAVFCLSYL